MWVYKKIINCQDHNRQSKNSKNHFIQTYTRLCKTASGCESQNYATVTPNIESLLGKIILLFCY